MQINYEKLYINKLSGTQTLKVQTYAALKHNSFKRSLRWQKKWKTRRKINRKECQIQ